MKAGVHVSVIYLDPSLLELRVQASNGVFAGQTDIYVNTEAPRALAANLNGFPTNKSDVRECQLGTFKSEMAGGGVKLRFYCVDSLGHAAVEICLQTDGPPDVNNYARFHMPVEAAAVDRFVHQVAVMSAKIGDEAWLEAAQ